MSDFTITGLREIDRALEELESRVGRKLLRQSLRGGAKKQAKDVKERQPVDEEGNLPKQIKVKAGPRSRTYASVDVIAQSSDEWYAPFVEFGTKNQSAQGNWRESYEREGENTNNFMLNDLRGRIDDEIRKLRVN